MTRLLKTSIKGTPYQILIPQKYKDDKVYILKVLFPSL